MIRASEARELKTVEASDLDKILAKIEQLIKGRAVKYNDLYLSMDHDDPSFCGLNGLKLFNKTFKTYSLTWFGQQVKDHLKSLGYEVTSNIEDPYFIISW